MSEISAMISTLNTDAKVAVLTVGIYLVVRGLGNMHQGIKDQSDLVVRKLVNWLNASPAAPVAPAAPNSAK